MQTITNTDGSTIDEMFDEENRSYLKRFDIEFGEVCVLDEASDRRLWLYKVTVTEDDETTVHYAGNHIDAVFGAIEEHTGGKL